MISTGLLLTLVLIASVTDVRSRMIYNWTTYPGIAAALAINLATAVLSADAVARWEWLVGWVGWAESLKGLAACGGLMLVCFVFFGIGGGDVKLMAMVGAFLGLEQGLEVLLWTFILGACLGLSVLIWRVGALTLLDRALTQFLALVRWGTPALSDEDRKQLDTKLFLAPGALVAALIVRFGWLDIW